VSPRIASVAWGRLELEDGSVYKDAKLWPGGSRAWDWRETGTAHAPGVQWEDVAELLKHGAEVVVIGCGFDGRLTVAPATATALRERDIPVHALPTEEAVRVYGELAGTQAVGGLFHTTC
jgi:hypothetical protein